jgi:LDH2 family malate/lactate/ureidoglycolate dehydrogenase
VHAILPFGGYKGFALALAMQGLGVLAGSGLGDDKTYGYLIMAIKPDLLVPLEDFQRDMSEMLARVKATPRQPGVDEIRMPSERAFRERARSLREGIEIDRKIYDVLLALPQGQLPEPER